MVNPRLTHVTWRLVALWWRGVSTWAHVGVYGLLASMLGWIHLAEVHLVDPSMSAWMRGATGSAFDAFARLEAPLTHAIGAWHARPLVAVVVVFYLGAFLWLLLAVPAIVASTGDGRLLRRTLLAYPLTYALAVPFYLLYPSTNPYTYWGLPSPFDAVHPDLEFYYYLLTTRDNTFPSLHVAFTVVLVAQVLRTRYRRLHAPVLLAGLGLALSIVFLRVHYVLDALGGLGAAWVALRLADACLAQEGPLARVGRALDRASLRVTFARTRAYRALEARIVPALRLRAAARPYVLAVAPDADDAVVRHAREPVAVADLEE